MQTLLASWNATRWSPQTPLRALCREICLEPVLNHRTPHETPHEGCTCGIYARKAPPTNATCWGEVYLWGKVIECESGYRAEFAYPKSLTVVGTAELAKALAIAYGVEVTLVERDPVPAPQPMPVPQPMLPNYGSVFQQNPYHHPLGPYIPLTVNTTTGTLPHNEKIIHWIGR